MLDPSTRDVSDVKHTVVAAASTSSIERAKKFLQECNCPSDAAAYGSYAELVNDKNVDIVYIATPHSHHYQNAMLCLEAGKHVLCEKAFTVNAAQAKKLVETAKAKKLFLMEAVWTLYFPLSIQIRKLITDGAIGNVHRVIADFSFGGDTEKKYGTSHRMVNMDLAGGALLDRKATLLHPLPPSPFSKPLTPTRTVGIYSLTWVFQTLYHTQPASTRKSPTVTSSMTKYAPTGADEMTSMILTFPDTPSGGGSAHGIALTNLRVATDVDGHGATSKPAIRIQGTRGEIQVDGSAARPTHYRVIAAWDGSDSSAPDVKEVECPIPGKGMFWEADEAARCLRDGRLESEGLGWEEIVVIMETMDEVRRQNGLRYPERIESTDYPIEL